MKRTLIILLTILATASNAQIPTDNLVGYYPFSGNANDESTNSNDGTVFGPGLTTDRYSNASSAYLFDGVDDYINMGDPSSGDFDFALSESMSISVWVKLVSTGGIQVIVFKMKMAGGVHEEGYLLRLQPSGIPQFKVEDMGGINANSGSPVALDDDEWHHIVGIRDVAADQMKMYVDGILMGTSTDGTTTGSANNVDFLVGKSSFYGEHADGKIDDLRIYRMALTECEVWALYLEGLSGLDETESVDVCEGDDYTFPDGSTQSNITADVTYTSSFPSILTGCDSASMETTLNVQSVDESASQAGNVLSANASGLSYQWVNCDDGFAAIPGETNQEYTATENGNYAVIVTDGDCSDTSECLHVSNIGVEKVPTARLQLYPNPVLNELNLHLGSVRSGKIEIVSATGAVKLSQTFTNSEQLQIPVESLASGLYFVKFSALDEQSIIRFVKE